MKDEKNTNLSLTKEEVTDLAPPGAAAGSSGLASKAIGFAKQVVEFIPALQAPTGDFKQPLNDDPNDPFRGIAPRRGDVLVVNRASGLYQHYGVYIGHGRVIHYAAENGDFGGHITIHEADLSEFQGPSDQIFVLNFPENGDLPAPSGQESPLFDILRAGSYHLYSPEETVARARQREGQEKYGLPWNNCEHFALWAKTGVHESRQVNAWATRIARWIIGARRRR